MDLEEVGQPRGVEVAVIPAPAQEVIPPMPKRPPPRPDVPTMWPDHLVDWGYHTGGLFPIGPDHALCQPLGDGGFQCATVAVRLKPNLQRAAGAGAGSGAAGAGESSPDPSPFDRVWSQDSVDRKRAHTELDKDQDESSLDQDQGAYDINEDIKPGAAADVIEMAVRQGQEHIIQSFITQMVSSGRSTKSGQGHNAGSSNGCNPPRTNAHHNDDHEEGQTKEVVEQAMMLEKVEYDLLVLWASKMAWPKAALGLPAHARRQAS